jgi:hypothetical protein
LDADALEMLNDATLWELYRLAVLVEQLLSDPRRTVAVRKRYTSPDHALRR